MKKLIATIAAVIGIAASAFADTYNLADVKARTTFSGVGHVLTGTLGKNVKISLADGAEFTFKDVTIKPTDAFKKDYSWAGITCEGNDALYIAPVSI